MLMTSSQFLPIFSTTTLPKKLSFLKYFWIYFHLQSSIFLQFLFWDTVHIVFCFLSHYTGCDNFKMVIHKCRNILLNSFYHLFMPRPCFTPSVIVEQFGSRPDFILLNTFMSLKTQQIFSYTFNGDKTCEYDKYTCPSENESQVFHYLSSSTTFQHAN